MPRKKEYSADADRVQAWRIKNIKTLSVDIREDGPITRDTIKKAAQALNLPVAAFIMQAVAKYILDQLGPEWLQENRNNAQGDKDNEQA